MNPRPLLSTLTLLLLVGLLSAGIVAWGSASYFHHIQEEHLRFEGDLVATLVASHEEAFLSKVFETPRPVRLRLEGANLSFDSLESTNPGEGSLGLSFAPIHHLTKDLPAGQTIILSASYPGGLALLLGHTQPLLILFLLAGLGAFSLRHRLFPVVTKDDSSEQVLLPLLEGLECPAILLDEKGDILYQNPRAHPRDVQKEPIDNLPKEGIQPIALPDGRQVLLLSENRAREDMSALRREFTSNVSHELKSPIHVISGYAELMSQGLLPENDVPSAAKKILDASEHMRRLIDDLLYLTRLDEGDLYMAKEHFDVSSLVDDVVGAYEEEMKERRLTLTCKTSSVMATGIRPLLETALKNLVENAIAYNVEGGSLSISLREEKGEVHLSVADTGHGIAPEELERIFERFYRVEKSHSRHLGGTGLGLSIVKHAMSAHQGRVVVKSHLGEGSTFTLIFPREFHEKSDA